MTAPRKIIVHTALWKQIVFVIICWCNVIFVLLSMEGWESTWEKWVGLAAFGAVAIFGTYQLLSPRYRFLVPGSKAYKNHFQERTVEEVNDEGIFTYDEDGFTVELPSGEKCIKWHDIETVLAYKLDVFVYDDIVIELRMVDGEALTVPEETWGRNQFRQRLEEHIPTIPKDWFGEMMQPPFKRNLTLLYDRNGRSLAEVSS